MLVQFQITPVGVGEHLSGFLKAVAKLIKDSGLPHQIGSMGTVVEGRWQDIMTLIDQCRQQVLDQAPRVLISMTIDDHPGKDDMLHYKPQALEDRT